MPDPREEAGQALVELALILPLFFFSIFVYFEVARLCRRAILLQNTAAVAARQEAISGGGGSRAIQNPSVVIRKAVSPLDPWRPFKGLAVVKERGSLLSVEAGEAFLPHHFLGWLLPPITLTYRAEFPQEPPVPQER